MWPVAVAEKDPVERVQIRPAQATAGPHLHSQGFILAARPGLHFRAEERGWIAAHYSTR